MPVLPVESIQRPKDEEGPEVVEPAPPNARERKRLETRERIREIALEEFRQVGFANAQIDKIVEKAGVARGTFYFHFKTKDHVLLEAQRVGESDIVERLRAMGPTPDSVAEFLMRIFKSIYYSLDEDPHLRREILAMYVRQPMNIELSDEPLIVELVDYLNDAVERGVVRTDIAPEILALRYLGSFFPLLIGDHITEVSEEEALDEVATAIEIFMNGISTKADLT